MLSFSQRGKAFNFARMQLREFFNIFWIDLITIPGKRKTIFVSTHASTARDPAGKKINKVLDVLRLIVATQRWQFNVTDRPGNAPERGKQRWSSG